MDLVDKIKDDADAPSLTPKSLFKCLIRVFHRRLRDKKYLQGHSRDSRASTQASFVAQHFILIESSAIAWRKVPNSQCTSGLQRRPGKNFLTDDIGRAQMVPEVRSSA